MCLVLEGSCNNSPPQWRNLRVPPLNTAWIVQAEQLLPGSVLAHILPSSIHSFRNGRICHPFTARRALEADVFTHPNVFHGLFFFYVASAAAALCRALCSFSLVYILYFITCVDAFCTRFCSLFALFIHYLRYFFGIFLKLLTSFVSLHHRAR